ncbi:MAG TPA: SDR family oxidoreductase [Thermoguttaceae bacterium]|nr:SDR family oxidoreductase [Thermoguttaceae bacterium]
MGLKDKTALVTGGGSGIGLGIAEALAREGCRVAISGRTESKLQEAAAGIDGDRPVLTHPCDVADRDSVRRLVDWAERELGPLDIVVNSAGINVAKRAMHELDPADFERILAVNCTGLFHVMQAVLPGMRARKGGLIVNISSIAGKRALPLAGPSYAASKFAATALGTAVGLEERSHGIRITNIYPGEVDTPILDQRPVPVPAEKKAVMVHPADIAACVVTIAKLPPHVLVPELVITPLYQDYL